MFAPLIDFDFDHQMDLNFVFLFLKGSRQKVAAVNLFKVELHVDVDIRPYMAFIGTTTFYLNFQ